MTKSEEGFYLSETFRRMALIREVEALIQKDHKSGAISIPIYLGRGQESIAASLATIFETSVAVFPQHRGHSYFLAFGGSPGVLMSAIRADGKHPECQMWGSASVAVPDRLVFGHSGLMGDQVPIAVGYCLATGTLTLSIVGDASAEEDYVLGALGFAAHKGLPFLLVCEDNDYSILTPKSARRGWSFTAVAAAFGCEARETSDDPLEIRLAVMEWNRKGPLVLNVTTSRHLWHAGSGQDANPTFDRYAAVKGELSRRYGSSKVSDLESEARVGAAK